MTADPEYMYDRNSRMSSESSEEIVQHIFWLTIAAGDQVDIATRLGASAVAPTDRRYTVGHEPAQYSRGLVSTHTPLRQCVRHLGAEYVR